MRVISYFYRAFGSIGLNFSVWWRNCCSIMEKLLKKGAPWLMFVSWWSCARDWLWTNTKCWKVVSYPMMCYFHLQWDVRLCFFSFLFFFHFWPDFLMLALNWIALEYLYSVSICTSWDMTIYECVTICIFGTVPLMFEMYVSISRAISSAKHIFDKKQCCVITVAFLNYYYRLVMHS